jgi:Cu+-exporting ATPase
VIGGTRLNQLPAYLSFARATRRVIGLCLFVSLVFNVAGLSLAIAGQLTPLATAIFMPASSLAIIGLAVGMTRWQGRRVPAS